MQDSTEQVPVSQASAGQSPVQENISKPRPQQIPREMHRIVVSDGDEPDWMVSANRVSGAAGRRGTTAAKAAQPEEK